MIRKADAKDIPELAAFLEARIASSMFLLGNLEAHGIGNTDHRHGTHYFLRETGDGINGVFGCTNGGFLMCQLPGLTSTEAQTYAHLLKGYTLHGMTGVSDQVALILEALGLPMAAWHLNRVEPLYTMPIAGLTCAAEIRAPIEADRAMLAEWFTGYLQDTGLHSAADAQLKGPERAAEALHTQQARLLIRDGAPVAMAALNASAGSAVQVGGVFVPQPLRGQGLGGEVVQALLAECAGNGAGTAILFAASAAAAKSYERIGFEQVGSYRIAMLAQPTTLPSAA